MERVILELAVLCVGWWWWVYAQSLYIFLVKSSEVRVGSILNKEGEEREALMMKMAMMIEMTLWKVQSY